VNFIKTTLVSTLLAISPVTLAGLIDFEDYASSTIIDNEYYLSDGITFNGVNIAKNADNLAVLFDTNNYTGGDRDLAAPFFNNGNLGEISPGNVLIIHENPNECNESICTNPDDEGNRAAGYFSINFAEAVTLNSIDFFDIEVEEYGISEFNLISFFDSNDNEISPNTFYTPDTGGDNQWARLDFGVSGVSSIKISLYGSGAIDNINYTKVPEPTTLAIFALGIIGLASRRFLLAKKRL
jgi:hypothetical protein